MNGKVHTFQKDFDNYEDYQGFLDNNPEYNPSSIFRNFWNPWSAWDRVLPNYENTRLLPADTRHLPEGIDLEKYEKRRLEKRQTEAEKAEKRHSLERTKEYLEDFLAENPGDPDATADLEKIESELKTLA